MSFFPEEKSRVRNLGPILSYRTAPFVGAPFRAPIIRQGRVSETIISQCHAGTWPPMRGSESDVGGSMDLTRSELSYPEYSHINAPTLKGYVTLQTTALFYVMGLETAVPGSNSTLNAFGTSAVARVLPTNPNSSLSTALGELKKDGLPHLPGSSMRDQVGRAHRAGSEFLNVEFGWLPLLSDLRAFADSVKRSRQLIDQYRRDSDRKIRRRFTPVPFVHEVSTFTGVGQGSGSMFFPGTTVTKTKSEQFSFSGAFRYHVPVGDDFYSRLRRYEQYSNLLFDTRLTPELLWNLAPWSWAVDWFTNAGDVIHNISRLGSDGLVMQYGYSMRHAYIEEFARGSYDYQSGSFRQRGTCALRQLTETKQRRHANPYGFGVDDLSLSAIQLAILTALGLTRGQRAGK